MLTTAVLNVVHYCLKDSFVLYIINQKKLLGTRGTFMWWISLAYSGESMSSVYMGLNVGNKKFVFIE